MTARQLDCEGAALQPQGKVHMLDMIQSSIRVDLNEQIGKGDAAPRNACRGRNAWEIAKVARHVDRPHATDYVAALFTDFVELHGDRAHSDDAAIVAGLARFHGRPLVLIGHQKGRNAKERVRRNFGMPRPEGYRKAMRMMDMAERFQLPLVTLIDTPGAFPGIEAEERGQSAAIGETICRMSQLQVPTVSIVIGEGGSGGALAIGVADVVCMLEFATYSVISPEGCASILWKDSANAEAAADALGITAARLKALGLIDEVIAEPSGGAHRDPATAAKRVGATLRRVLSSLDAMANSKRLARRRARLRAFGVFGEDDELKRAIEQTRHRDGSAKAS